MPGELEVAVVLHHADELHVGNRAAVELAQLGLGECAGELEGAVAAEVEEDHSGAVADRPNRLAVGIGDDEGEEILVNHARVLVAKGLYRLGRVRERAALAQNVVLPAALDHRPVGVVPVHGDEHAPAARGDAVVAAASLIELVQDFFERIDVLERARLGDVAAVEQNVHARLLNALFVATA